MSEFKIGDRVKLINTTDVGGQLNINDGGTVRHLNGSNNIGVAWDTITHGHDLDAHINNTRGWYVHSKHLALTKINNWRKVIENG